MRNPITRSIRFVLSSIAGAVWVSALTDKPKLVGAAADIASLQEKLAAQCDKLLTESQHMKAMALEMTEKAIVAENEADRLYLAVSRLKDLTSEYRGDTPLYPSLLVDADVNNVERAA